MQAQVFRDDVLIGTVSLACIYNVSSSMKYTI